MLKTRVPAAAAASVALLAAVAAVAQEPPAPAEAPPPVEVAPLPTDDPLAPDASGMAEEALATEEALDEGMVEVSLGDWAVKNEVADALAVSVAAVPLTVIVDPGLAAEVCPASGEALNEQGVASPTRTCAAKTFVPALADHAREQMRPPE